MLKDIIKSSVLFPEKSTKMVPCTGTIQKIYNDCYDVLVNNQNGQGVIVLNRVPSVKQSSVSTFFCVGDRVFITFNGGSSAGAMILGKIKDDKGQNRNGEYVEQSFIDTDKTCSYLIGKHYGSFEGIDIEKLKEDLISKYLKQNIVSFSHPVLSSSLIFDNSGSVKIGNDSASIIITSDGKIFFNGEVDK